MNFNNMSSKEIIEYFERTSLDEIKQLSREDAKAIFKKLSVEEIKKLPVDKAYFAYCNLFEKSIAPVYYSIGGGLSLEQMEELSTLSWRYEDFFLHTEKDLTLQQKEELAKKYNCSVDEISSHKQDILDGKKIVCFYGNILMENVTNIDGLVFPENVEGVVHLYAVKSAVGTVFPKNVKVSFFLGSLPYAEDLIFPEYIGGACDLRGLESANGVVFPKYVGSMMSIKKLKSLDGISIPEGFEYRIFQSDHFTIDDLKSLAKPNGLKK